MTIHRKPDDELIVGEDWHTDTTMMAEPPMGALLYALDVPEFGGDTLFANQYLAYESLSDGMKELLGGMRCIHTDRKVAGPDSRVAKFKRSTAVRLDDEWCETRNSHPVIRTHPETGRKCLFVNHSYSVAFEGMTEEESAPLLNWLLDWGNRPEITCRFAGKGLTRFLGQSLRQTHRRPRYPTRGTSYAAGPDRGREGV